MHKYLRGFRKFFETTSLNRPFVESEFELLFRIRKDPVQQNYSTIHVDFNDLLQQLSGSLFLSSGTWLLDSTVLITSVSPCYILFRPQLTNFQNIYEYISNMKYV